MDIKIIHYILEHIPSFNNAPLNGPQNFGDMPPADDRDIRIPQFTILNNSQDTTGLQGNNILQWLEKMFGNPNSLSLSRNDPNEVNSSPFQPFQFFGHDGNFREQTVLSETQTPPPPGTNNTPVTTNSSDPLKPGSYARNLQEAAANTNPKFMPIIRGDEAEQNSRIHDQESFGRAVDQVALEYGLDPNQFRAQLQKESGAMTDYRKAMLLEGDLGRAGENNTSIGIGQISRKFLDGREWSDGGPNNPRVGGKTVTTEFYNSSAITQLRIAAANLAMRIEDHGQGDLVKGLRYYVSGHTTQDAQNDLYINSINEIMQDEKLMNIGRS